MRASQTAEAARRAMQRGQEGLKALTPPPAGDFLNGLVKAVPHNIYMVFTDDDIYFDECSHVSRNRDISWEGLNVMVVGDSHLAYAEVVG